ncbi:MAG TPA: sugar phosphate isomerase/epimerase [Bryobacteraceae bacterium]|nr:sugar phosphate isomerase/epimerase [Bryobacteraceae bacterium]
MNLLSRRDFVSTTAVSLSAAAQLAADPLGLPIGCQTYPVRQALDKDFEGTLRQLAAIGYKTIEMCSPPGYAKSGYGSLLSMKASDMRRKIKAAGLGCESCHYQFRELKENLDDRMAYAKELGLKQMIIASLSMRRDATMADWMRAAEDMNKIGEQTHKAGLQLGFHNHNTEFQQLDGTLIYDQLMSKTDPKLVKMQFQVAVISLGHEAVTFFEKYPGRFISLHLQDWSPAEKKLVAVGAGSVDWKRLFTAAKNSGVKNYFVELDMDALKASYPYLHKLKV